MFGGRRVRSRSQRRNRSTNVRRSKNVRRSRSGSRSRSRSRSGSTRRARRTRRRQRGKGDPRWVGHSTGVVATTGSSIKQNCYNLVKKKEQCPEGDVYNLGNLQVYNKPTNTFEPATDDEKKLHCCARDK